MYRVAVDFHAVQFGKTFAKCVGLKHGFQSRHRRFPVLIHNHRRLRIFFLGSNAKNYLNKVSLRAQKTNRTHAIQQLVNKRVHDSSKFIKICLFSAKNIDHCHHQHQQRHHQRPFTPNNFYTRQRLKTKFLTPYNLYTNQPTIPPTPFTPDTLYTKQLLPQTPFTPDTFYTKHFLRQPPFAPDTFCARNRSHQTLFAPDTCYTKQFLHRTPFTKQLLHQTPFTPNNFYTKRFFHSTPTPFTPQSLFRQTPFPPDVTNNFYTKATFPPGIFYTRHLLHRAPFTPESFYTRHLLHQQTPNNSHQTHFTPNCFYTRKLFKPNNIYSKQLLQQETFTPGTFYTRHLSARNMSHQTAFTPNAFSAKHVVHQVILESMQKLTKHSQLHFEQQDLSLFAFLQLQSSLSEDMLNSTAPMACLHTQQ